MLILYHWNQPYFRAIKVFATNNRNRTRLRDGRPGLDFRLRQIFSEQFYLVGYNAIQPGENQPAFRRKKRGSGCCLFHAGFLLDLLFNHDGFGGDISSETSVEFHCTTWRYIPNHRNLHNGRCENVKSLRDVSFLQADCSSFYQLRVGFLLGLFLTLKMESVAPPQRRFTFNGLHGFIFRKIK
jgi:hypothetical protein